ncbi:MAG: NAD(P)/FAD-dependent oxidoreductase [Oligoflexia bacterium]|nr:NAD(P)/FAD-dependent oxidoreductase [Oligoflexia bacterium]
MKDTINNINKIKILIVGGGFAGITAAKKLSKEDNLEITLVDKNNYHLFQPLLYQVAIAGLNPGEIAFPIRRIFANKKNVYVYLDEIKYIDFDQRQVCSEKCQYSYDYLILACGSISSYFGHDNWGITAPTLKTLEDSINIRERVLSAFELAELAEIEKKDQLAKIKKYLTFVIIGAGPTGVELAGAIAEFAKHTLKGEFRSIDPSSSEIILLEAGPRILPSFSEDLSIKAQQTLKDLTVKVLVNCKVISISDGVIETNQERFESYTILWAAGVGANPINSTIKQPLDRQGAIQVERDLSLKAFANVFVIGDQASLTDSHGIKLPGVASVALQQGRHVADNIKRLIQKKSTIPFNYLDKGQMATIGRNKAIAQIGQLHLWGFFAWLIWLFVHIYFLIGFKNRIFVFFQWAWSYATYARAVRFILSSSKE